MIRGMEIPKEPTNITIYPDGCWCDYTSNDSHGKFVVLPEGHGRLIDTDKLQKKLRNVGLFNLALYLDYAPTILEAEGGADNG